MTSVQSARIIDPQSIEFVSPFRSIFSSAETLLPKRVEEFAPNFGPAAIGQLFRAVIDRLNRNFFSQSAENPQRSDENPENEAAPEETETDGRKVFKVAPDYGGWKLTQEGNEESIACALTKAEVEAKAKQVAEEHDGPCSIRIHDREGNFESEVKSEV